MPDSFIETLGPGLERIYFTDPDGAKWRVHHCVLVRGKGTLRIARADERETHRVYVAANGVKRSYRFTCGESQQLTATLLAVQLREAEYVGTSAFDSRTRAALSGAPIRQTLCD